MQVILERKNGVAPSAGREYGFTQLPNPWTAVFRVVSVVRVTGDGANFYLCNITVLDADNYLGWRNTNDGDYSQVLNHGAKTSLYVTGSVKDDGDDGIEDVLVSAGGESDLTSASGSYTVTGITAPLTGDVTPTKEGYTFVPTEQSFSDVFFNQTGVNFVGGLTPPGKAQNPTPSDDAENVSKSLSKLEWEAPN